MLKKVILSILVLVSIASCKTRTAFNYSESFVKKERSLTTDITATENKIAAFGAAHQYDSIAVIAERMEKKVEDKIREVKNEPAPDVKGADNFKEACLKYFDYIKSFYTNYKKAGLAKTDTEREAAITKVMELANNKQQVIETIKTAQQKFADANGFKMEK